MADASLATLLTGHALPEHDVHAVYPSPKLVPAKVRSLVAFLQERLAGE